VINNPAPAQGVVHQAGPSPLSVERMEAQPSTGSAATQRPQGSL